MKRLAVLLVLLSLALLSLVAATPLVYQNGVEYYEPTSAKTKATGNGGLLYLEDSTALFRNPARLGKMTKSSVASEVFFATNYDMEAGVTAFSRFGLATAFHLSYNSYYDAFLSYALGYGQSVVLNGKVLSLGLSAAILTNAQADKTTVLNEREPLHLSFPFSVGTVLDYDFGLSLGATVRNLFGSYRQMENLLQKSEFPSFREEWKRAEVSYEKELTGDIAVAYHFRTVDAAIEFDVREVRGFLDTLEHGSFNREEKILSHLSLSGCYEVLGNYPIYIGWTGYHLSLGAGYSLGPLEVTGEGDLNVYTGAVSGSIGVLLAF